MKQFYALCFLLFCTSSFAQKSSEIGVIGGGGFYLGELNHALFAKESTKLMYGVVARINPNPRVSFRLNLLKGSISGDDGFSADPLENDRNLHFRSTIHEVSFQVEFNYFTFELGNPRYPFTNYLFGGLGFFKFSPVGQLGASWESLRGLPTEYEKKNYPLIQPSLPFGGGVKINFSDKITASAEWGLRITFTDYLDDVSTIYPTTFEQRGNSKTKDFYSFFGLMITYVMKNDDSCPELLSGVR